MGLWMISNRNVTSTGFGVDRADRITYWTAGDAQPPAEFASWSKQTLPNFKDMLLKATQSFPGPTATGDHEDQKHVTLLIHGYNFDWKSAATWYQGVQQKLFAPGTGLGECILFNWPSKGSPADYLPDRHEAESSAGDLADVLSEMYDWIVALQAKAARDSASACRTKTSVIAHSMGNYLLQRAAATTWTRKSQPLLVSLINQLVMVAADVDNDLFKGGENVSKSDGDALANLTYRITALYTGLDQVLGLSSGLKHFGKRRLGRTGPDPFVNEPDNVWSIDCSPFIKAAHQGPIAAHGAYFDVADTIELMRQLLRGVDRTLVRGWVEARIGARPK